MSSSWRHQKTPVPKPNSFVGKEIIKKIKELERKAKTEGTTRPSRPGELNQIVLKRIVSAKRGKWIRFPLEVINRWKKPDGNWIDIPFDKD